VTKGPQAFRTISEAADLVGVGQHVLRFWESRFSFIRPVKCAGGRRFYRPRDLVLLSEIRRLLRDEGHTIKSVQQLYRQGGLGRSSAREELAPGEAPDLARRRLEATLRELNLARARLQAAIDRPA
jgi:DNA-binding transcriptional MerR regulator